MQNVVSHKYAFFFSLTALLIFIFLCIKLILKDERVYFEPIGLSSSRKAIQIRIVNKSSQAVEVHSRDYMFKVTCFGEKSGEWLLPYDSSIEWGQLIKGSGMIVEPGESREISVSFNLFRENFDDCKIMDIQYDWQEQKRKERDG